MHRHSDIRNVLQSQHGGRRSGCLAVITGGIAGRKINKKIDTAAVEKLFIALMAVIIVISLWNTYRYLVLGG